MTPKHFDDLIIGAGQAGPFLAGRLAASGREVAIVERKLIGGTCINTGCTPTKTMVASAYAAHLVRRSAEFGVHVSGDVRIDMTRVKARREEIVATAREGIRSWLATMNNCTVINGHARFETAHELGVGGERLTAERIFLNVGGRAFVPAMAGLEEVKFLTNSSLLEIDFVPKHLLVVGGSYIGLEFGQMFRRFGSEVTIIEMGPRLVRREDEDVSAAIHDILAGEGIRIRLNAKCISFSRRGEEAIARVDCADGAPEISGTHVLLAVGRVPNTNDLGLENAGIVTDKHGYITVDDQLRTNVAGIWAMGDCNGRGAFTHTAFNDAEIVVGNLLENAPRRVTDRVPAYALYIDPPLGRCGLTEAEVRQRGRPALVGKIPMAKIKRAIEKGETQGFMKIFVDAETREILGAAILGSGGDEIIHSILDAIYAKAPAGILQRAMHIHPTISELIPTMLGELVPL